MAERKKRDERSYKDKLLDPRWQKKRLRILERDKWACRCCGDKESTLHVHHVHYDPRAEGPWDYADTSLVTLCAECHDYEGPELVIYRNLLIQTLVAAGCWKSSQFAMLSDALTTSSPMDNKELDAFSWAVMCLIQSRETYLATKSGKEHIPYCDETSWLNVVHAFSTPREGA